LEDQISGFKEEMETLDHRITWRSIEEKNSLHAVGVFFAFALVGVTAGGLFVAFTYFLP